MKMLLLLSLIFNLLKITSQGVGDMLELDQVHPVTGYTGGMATPWYGQQQPTQDVRCLADDDTATEDDVFWNAH